MVSACHIPKHKKLPGLKNFSNVTTKVYPNPVKSVITIIAGSNFVDAKNITLNIYDLMDKVVKTNVVSYRKGNVVQLDLTELPSADYLELRQGSINEHIKITK